MSAEVFLDTNILVYLLSDDAAKAARSETILLNGGTISVQVLSEFVNVTRNRRSIEWDVVEESLATFRTVLHVEPLTLETQRLGVSLCRKHGFSIFDGTIVAAAQLAGCTTLLSEDMQDGRIIAGLTIRNPYR